MVTVQVWLEVSAADDRTSLQAEGLADSPSITDVFQIPCDLRHLGYETHRFGIVKRVRLPVRRFPHRSLFPGPTATENSLPNGQDVRARAIMSRCARSVLRGITWKCARGWSGFRGLFTGREGEQFGCNRLDLALDGGWVQRLVLPAELGFDRRADRALVGQDPLIRRGRQVVLLCGLSAVALLGDEFLLGPEVVGQEPQQLPDSVQQLQFAGVS